MILENQVISILEGIYVEDYKIKLIFNDNKVQLIDFSLFLNTSLNPLIRKYLNLNEFKKFKIVDGDLQWNDYDLCFSIADLYENNIKP